MKQKNTIMLIATIIIAIIILVAITYLSKIKSQIRFIVYGNPNITLEVGEQYTESGFEASIAGRNIADKVVVKSNLNTNVVGNYEISYNLNIKYLAYNKTLKRTIEVKDTTKPTLKVESEKEIIHYIGNKFQIPQYTAIDNYNGDITDKVVVKSNVDENKLGTYEITYNVSDTNNNEATDKITVHVKKKKNPYIIVSISKQTLQYYEYDQLVLTSNVVTGINNKTPRGTFKVLYKGRNIILRGQDYESFVNYWIAFRGNSLGFHDASWRSRFGGQIYKTNGSHGCVNMPYSKVKQLYNLVDIGTPVYIKN